MGFSTIRYICSHPLSSRHKFGALWSFVKWQVESRTIKPRKSFQWVENTKLNISRGETGVSGNLYCGLHEFGEMGFVLHLLRSSETFVDVGANAGTYTVLASGVCSARSISFEPLPEAFGRMKRNIEINHLENLVTLHKKGVADKVGELKFTRDYDTGNHVLLEDDPNVNVEIVAVVSLDEVLKHEIPVLIKIDVEGFEKQVLKGAMNVLEKESLLAVIMETNDAGSEFGYSKKDLHALMRSFGFYPYFYKPFNRELETIRSADETDLNCVFIRDIEAVKKRVAEAPKRKVLGVSF